MLIVKITRENSVLIFSSLSPGIILENSSNECINPESLSIASTEDLEEIRNLFPKNHLIFNDLEGSNIYIDKEGNKKLSMFSNKILNSYDTYLFCAEYVGCFIKQLISFGYFPPSSDWGENSDVTFGLFNSFYKIDNKIKDLYNSYKKNSDYPN